MGAGCVKLCCAYYPHSPANIVLPAAETAVSQQRASLFNRRLCSAQIKTSDLIVFNMFTLYQILKIFNSQSRY